MKLFVLLGSLTLSLAIAAPLSEIFSASDADSWAKAALDVIHAPASLSTTEDLSSVDYALQLLELLDKDKGEGTDWRWCDAAMDGARGGYNSLEGVYHGLSLSRKLGCGIPSRLSPVADALVNAGLSGSELEGLYFGVKAALEAGEGGPSFDPAAIVGKVGVMVQPTGEVRGSTEGVAVPATPENARRAAELLALLVKEGSGLAESAAAAVKSMEKALLPQESDNTATDATLLHPLLEAKGGALKLKVAQLKATAKQLLDARHARGDMRAMVRVLLSLRALASRPQTPPVVRFSPQVVTSDDTSNELLLLASNVLGGPMDGLHALELISLELDVGSAGAGGGVNLLKSGAVKLVSKGSGEWSAKLTTAAPPGRYTATITVIVEGLKKGGDPVPAKLPLLIAGDAKISSSSVIIKGEEVQLPLSSTTVSAAAGDAIRVTFAVDMVKGAPTPQQALVRVQSVIDSSLETFHLARFKKGPLGGEFSTVIDVESLAKLLQHKSGEYDLHILVGDVGLRQQLLEPLGTLSLKFPEKQVVHPRLYERALLYESDTALSALPEKHHTFRSADTRAPIYVSFVFTLVALSPLYFFSWALKKSGADLKGAGREKWTPAYLVCILLCLGLFVTYWVCLTMNTVLKVLPPLLALTLYVGRKAVTE